MKRIVIGYDGTDQAKDALRLAADLRKATGAQLIVSPVDEIEPYFGDLNLEQLNESRQDYFRRMFAEATEQLGDSDYERVVGQGSAPAALAQIAELHEADVLVIGSTHRAGLSRVLPGSVGDRLLSGAPCAIAIAPKGYAETSAGELGHVGVAYDGQHESDAALAAAIELARAAGADLKLIAVHRSAAQVGRGRGGMSPQAYVDILTEYLTERLTEGAERIPDAITTSTEIRSGHPAEELAEASRDLDVLCIGSRGYGPVRRVLLGGVAHDVMRSANCPMIIVPRSTEKSLRRAETHRIDEVVV